MIYRKGLCEFRVEPFELGKEDGWQVDVYNGLSYTTKKFNSQEKAIEFLGDKKEYYEPYPIIVDSKGVVHEVEEGYSFICYSENGSKFILDKDELKEFEKVDD